MRVAAGIDIKAGGLSSPEPASLGLPNEKLKRVLGPPSLVLFGLA